MDPLAEVALHDAPQPEPPGHVDHESEIDPVALDEGNLLEDLTTGRAFAGQRLDHG